MIRGSSIGILKLVLLLCTKWTLAQETQEFRMLYNPPLNSYPIVFLQINNSQPQPFLLDTGLQAELTIEKGILNAMGLKAKPTTVREAKSGNLFQGEMATIRSVKLMSEENTQGMPIAIKTALVTNFNKHFSQTRPVGLLSLAAFRKFVVTFDFTRQKLIVSKSPLPPNGNRSKTLPLIYKNASEGDYRLVAPTRFINELPQNLMIDTGGATPFLPTALKKTVERGSLSKYSEQMSFVDPMSTDKQLKLTEVDYHLMGKFLDETNVVVATSDAPLSPSIGISYLSRFRVTIDFPKMELRLEDASDYQRRSILPGNARIYLKMRQGKYYVESVDNGSTAEKGGVKVGDEIRKIDGTELSGLPIEFVYELLDAYSGTTATLEMTRRDSANSEQVLTVKFVRDNAFPNLISETGTIGAFIIREGNHWVVSEVKPNSSSEAAGMKVGDILLAINDTEISSLTLQQIVPLLEKPPGTWFTLKIQRMSEVSPIIIRTVSRRKI